MPSENEQLTQNYQRYLKDEQRRLGCPSNQSATNGDDQNTVCRSDSQRGDSSGEKSITSAGAATAGKILEQLKELQAAHLKYVDADRQQLQARLNETDEHRRKIVADMQRLEGQIKELLAESGTEIE
jgi:hypothetical protein